MKIPKKTTYVSFPKNAIPRIYINQKPTDGHPYVVNPDLSKVRGLSPEKWKRKDIEVHRKFSFTQQQLNQSLIISLALNMAAAIYLLW